jgi:class 3 adenylate cyclase
MTEHRKRHLAAVWFADIVGYTKLAARDENAALAVVDELQRIAREEVEARDGRIVKFQGDGVLSVFDSADASLRSALALRDGFTGSEAARRHECAIRIGVHVVEVVEAEDGDVYGDGVNTASRIEGQAEPGQVVVSEGVHRLLKQQAAHEFGRFGPVKLKGVPEPMWLYVVGEAGVTVLVPQESRDPQRSLTSEFLDALTSALGDRYKIERELGVGGMATVYLARDLRHGRQVAIKVPHPSLSESLGVERFLNEIRTTAQLQHPHILPLYDCGKSTDRLFYVMPFVQGESLRERL